MRFNNDGKNSDKINKIFEQDTSDDSKLSYISLSLAEGALENFTKEEIESEVVKVWTKIKTFESLPLEERLKQTIPYKNVKQDTHYINHSFVPVKYTKIGFKTTLELSDKSLYDMGVKIGSKISLLCRKYDRPGDFSNPIYYIREKTFEDRSSFFWGDYIAVKVENA